MKVHFSKKVQEATVKVYVFNVAKSTKDIALLQFDRITDSIEDILQSDEGISLMQKEFYVFDNKTWEKISYKCLDTLNYVFIFSDKDISDKAILLVE